MISAPQFLAARQPGTLVWVVAESERGERFPGLLLRVKEGETGVPGHPMPVHVRMGMFTWGDVCPVVLMVSALGYVSETWINLAHEDAREWMTLLAREQPLVLSLVVTEGRIGRTVVVPSRAVSPTAAAILAAVAQEGAGWSDPAFDQAKAEIMGQFSITSLWEFLGNPKGGNEHGH